MEQQPRMKNNNILPIRTITVISVMLIVVATVTSAFKGKNDFTGDDEDFYPAKDSVESVMAFMDVYKVLMSPRCMNCHPAGDIPLQGDSSKLHTMLPRRGKEGKGVFAMKCANCHQPANIPGLHTPPGNPNWHLPPANIKMVFQGKTPHQLAKQLVDPNRNGHKNMKQLLAHANDTLVLAGWNPGDGRTLPPLTHAEFAKAWVTWIKTGAYAPKQ